MIGCLWKGTFIPLGAAIARKIAGSRMNDWPRRFNDNPERPDVSGTMLRKARRGAPSDLPSPGRNHEPCDPGACQDQGRAGQHEYSESKNKRLGNGAADHRCRSRIQIGGQVKAGELDRIRPNVLKDARRKHSVSETAIQTKTE